jgi:uncharacterized protein (TIGR03083 family)
MQHHEHVSALVDEIASFVEAIDGSDLATPVPSCPGWDLAELIRHQGTVHRWAEWHVRHVAQERHASETLGIAAPDDDRQLVAWLAAGGAELVDTLRASDPDAAMWAWGTDQHARFWSRRQVHETLVHRADAQLALGLVPILDARLAVDAIDELFDNLPRAAYFAPNVAKLVGAGETLHLHCTDTDGEWMIHLLPDGFSYEHAHGKGDVAVRATAGDLLLLTYNRYARSDDRFEIFGDTDLLDQWLTNAAL